MWGRYALACCLLAHLFNVSYFYCMVIGRPRVGVQITHCTRSIMVSMSPLSISAHGWVVAQTFWHLQETSSLGCLGFLLFASLTFSLPTSITSTNFDWIYGVRRHVDWTRLTGHISFTTLLARGGVTEPPVDCELICLLLDELATLKIMVQYVALMGRRYL